MDQPLIDGAEGKAVLGTLKAKGPAGVVFSSLKLAALIGSSKFGIG